MGIARLSCAQLMPGNSLKSMVIATTFVGLMNSLIYGRHALQNMSYKAVSVVTLSFISPLTVALHDLHLCTYKHTLLFKPYRRSQLLETTATKSDNTRHRAMFLIGRLGSSPSKRQDNAPTSLNCLFLSRYRETMCSMAVLRYGNV